MDEKKSSGTNLRQKTIDTNLGEVDKFCNTLILLLGLNLEKKMRILGLI